MERGTYSEHDDPGPWLVRHLGTSEMAPLEPDDVRELASALRVHLVAAGSTVFRTDELPSHVYVVRNGRIELTRERAGRTVTLQVLGEGEVFGDIPLFLRRPEPFDAKAIDDSLVFAIDSVHLLQLLGRRPRLARRWMISMAERMAATQDRVGDLLAANLEQQVALTLLHHADDGRVEMSQEMVARLVGARRTSVNQALRRLEERGLIRTGYRYITIENISGLSEVPV